MTRDAESDGAKQSEQGKAVQDILPEQVQPPKTLAALVTAEANGR